MFRYCCLGPPAQSIRQLLTRQGAKFRRYSDQMRDGSQRQSPSEVADALSNLGPQPSAALCHSRNSPPPALRRPKLGARLRKSIFALRANGAIRNGHRRESSGHLASYKGRLNAVAQLRCPPGPRAVVPASRDHQRTCTSGPTIDRETAGGAKCIHRAGRETRS